MAREYRWQCVGMRPGGDCVWRVGRVAWVVQYLALLLPFAMSMVSVVDSGVRLPPVYWNSTNTMFQSSNNDHVIDVHIGDSIDIICPHYMDDTVAWEYYIIYMVNKSNYEMCVINDTSKWTMILNCSKPNSTRANFYTLLILDFQSIPGNPDFAEGRSYYFISTSGGQKSNIDNQYLGACKTHKMRMIIRVVPPDDSPPQGTTLRPVSMQTPVQTNARTTSTASTTTSTTTRTTTTSATTTPVVSKITGRPDDTEERVPGSDGFPGDNVIHVGVGDKNEGTITDNGAHFLTPALTTLATTITVILTALCRR